MTTGLVTAVITAFSYLCSSASEDDLLPIATLLLAAPLRMQAPGVDPGGIVLHSSLAQEDP